MRKFLLTLLIVFLNVNLSAADISKFRNKAELRIDDIQGPQSFILTPQLAVDIKSESDMRIFDANQQLVPYLINFARERKIQKSTSVKVYNSGSTPGVEQSFEFTAPKTEKLINRLTLNIKEDNFSRTVSLFARGSENERYKLIKKGMRIVRMTEKQNSIRYSHTVLDFPPQNKRFYKVVIGLAGEQPLSVQSVDVIRHYNISSRRQYIDLEISKPNEEELRILQSQYPWRHHNLAKKSIYILRNPVGPLPLDKFELKLNANNFSRRAQLFSASNDLKKTNNVAKTSLFRYDDEDNLSFERSSNTRSQTYILDITHGDDLAFDVDSVRASFISAEVRFIRSADYQLPYTLYYSTPRPSRPSFDIAQTLKRKKDNNFTKVGIGAISANSAFEESIEEELKDSDPYILYLAIGVLVLGLLLYLVRLAKSAPPTTTND